MVIASSAATETINVEKGSISYIAGSLKLTFEEAKLLIQNILADTLAWTLIEVEEWINTYVPKRTGQLRENLIRNLQSSWVKGGFNIRLVIRTHIDYAAKVNAMSDAQVQHSGTWYEHSGARAYAYYYGYHGRIYLDDPEAIGGFFEVMQQYAKLRVFVNLAKAKARHLGYIYYSKTRGFYYKPSTDPYLVM